MLIWHPRGKCERVTCQETAMLQGFFSFYPEKQGRVCWMVPFKQEGWKLKPEHSVATGESSEESAVREAGPPSPCLEERQRTGEEGTEIGSRNHVRRLGGLKESKLISHWGKGTQLSKATRKDKQIPDSLTAPCVCVCACSLASELNMIFLTVASTTWVPVGTQT